MSLHFVESIVANDPSLYKWLLPIFPDLNLPLVELLDVKTFGRPRIIDGVVTGVSNYVLTGGVPIYEKEFDFVVSDGPIIIGRKNGIWREDRDGNIAIGEFVNGISQGIWKEYNIHGELANEGLVKNGKKEGRWRFYYRDIPLMYRDYSNGFQLPNVWSFGF